MLGFIIFELTHCLAPYGHETSCEQQPHLISLVRGGATQVLCGQGLVLMEALRV